MGIQRGTKGGQASCAKSCVAEEMSKTTVSKPDEIYNYIVTYKRQNDGNAPSVRQIALRCDLASTSQVDHYLNILETQNKIRRIGKGDGVDNRRHITVIGGRWSMEK